MWRTISSFLPTLRPGATEDLVSTRADVVDQGNLDPNGGYSVVKIQRPKGYGFAFTTLSTSQEAQSPDEKSVLRAPSGLNKFQVCAFGPGLSFCCGNSNNLFGNAKLAFAYKTNIQISENSMQGPIITRARDWGDIYWYSFSPHGDQAFAIRDKQTRLASWMISGPSHRQNTIPTYSSLIQWLRTHVAHEQDALSKSSVILGTGASYFARSATACIWHDLPDRLDGFLRQSGAATTALDGIIDTGAIPRLVALGAEDDYIAIMKDGAHDWSLNRTHFLRQKFREEAKEDVKTWECLALNPYNSRDFFLSKDNGVVHMKCEDIEAVACANLTGIILSYMQAKAHEEHRTYEVEIKIGERTINVGITPDTKWGGFMLSD